MATAILVLILRIKAGKWAANVVNLRPTCTTWKAENRNKLVLEGIISTHSLVDLLVGVSDDPESQLEYALRWTCNGTFAPAALKEGVNSAETSESLDAKV